MSLGPRTVTVFCTDDQAIFRDAMREIIAATPGLTHVGEAASGEAAIAAVAALRPDIVLMDIHMPGLGGFEAASILAGGRRSVLVILMSADPVEPPPGFPPAGAEVPFVAKAELCPRTLLDLWHGRRTHY
jgi:two-component system invasion response regulator UvrY